MATKNVKRNLIVHSEATGAIGATICKSLNIMVDKSAAANLVQPLSKVTDLSLAAWNKTFSSSVRTNQKSLLLQLVTMKYGSNPRERVSLTGKFEKKSEPLQDWQLMLIPLMVEKNILWEGIMEILFKNDELLSGNLETIKIKYSTINLKKRLLFICKQSFRTEHWARWRAEEAWWSLISIVLAPTTFQRALNNILSVFQWKNSLFLLMKLSSFLGINNNKLRTWIKWALLFQTEVILN